MPSAFNNQKGKNTSTVIRIPDVTRSENMDYTIDEALDDDIKRLFHTIDEKQFIAGINFM